MVEMSKLATSASRRSRRSSRRSGRLIGRANRETLAIILRLIQHKPGVIRNLDDLEPGMRMRLLSALIFLITFPLSASITGVVINIDGQPIAGAKVSIYAPETVAARSVRLFSKTPERTALATKQTDSKGAFSFDSPKGQAVVDLGIEASGFAPEAIRLLADDDAGAFALAAAPMKRGTIIANGKPVASATVVWLGNATDFLTTTDADGHYTVPDPSKWANRLIVIHPDYAVLDDVTNLRTTQKVDQALSAGTAIKGRVLAENGQTPVAKASLVIDDFPLATTADDGTFTIEHAPKNWQEVSARNGALGGLHARSGETAVTIRLAKLATITGTVRDAKSQLPLANAEVRLGPAMQFGGRRRGFSPMAAGPALDSVLTDAKGTFTFTAPAGQYNLSAIYPGSMISNASI